MSILVRICFSLSLMSFIAACGGDDDDQAGDGDDVADGADDAADDDGDGDATDGDSDGDSDGDDSGDGPSECVPGNTQCTDCEDNDDDGLIDGADPHCTGPLDQQEDSFATGIPGDNIDAKKQECFFDGDSGQCQVHTCCLLPEGAECPEELGQYNPPQSCSNLDAACLQNCLPVTPVGCDCYGCCTICNPVTDDCADILINPALAPDCGPEDIGEATMSECYACIKVEECNGGECDADPEDCILCPGQTEEDLPDTCNGNECPDSSACQVTSDCPDGDYCSTGCCVAGGVD